MKMRIAVEGLVSRITDLFFVTPLNSTAGTRTMAPLECHPFRCEGSVSDKTLRVM